MKIKSASKGFTLLEVIVSLVLVGILATIAGMGLVEATKGYLFAKDNTAKAQTGQLVMTRLSKAITNWTENPNQLTGWLPSSGTALTLERYQNDDLIHEMYEFENDRIYVNQTTTGGSFSQANRKLLAQNVDSLHFSYANTQGGTWNTSQKIYDLASVEINLTLSGQNSEPTTFTTRAVPRNTFNPGQHYLEAGSGSAMLPSCFVVTASYGSDDSIAVMLLKEFRDNYLTKFSGGRAFIKWYYHYGPNLADTIRKSENGKQAARFILSPIIGTIFLFMYYPEGFIYIILFILFLARIIRSRKHKEMAALKNTRGAALIFIIMALLLFSAIGVGILSMTTSSLYGQTGSNASTQAYLLAEGGFRYGAYTYTFGGTNGTGTGTYADSILTTLHNHAPFVVETGKTFEFDIMPYYFNLNNPSTASVTSDCAFPLYFSYDWIKNGYIEVNGTLYPYTGYNHVSNSFTGTGAITGGSGDDVFLAARTSSARTLDEGGYIELESGNVDAFPLMNGVIRITTSSDTYYATYHSRDSIGNRLTGLQKIETEKTIPFDVAVGNSVVLERYADVKVAGTVGAGENAVTRTITYSQPLFKLTMVTRKTWQHDFENDPTGVASPYFTNILGAHQVTAPDGTSNKALQITGTSGQTYYQGTLFFIPIAREFHESVIGLRQWLTDLGLYDAWLKSDNALSYDFQSKIRFVSNDDTETGNYLGTYMPGIAFRLSQNGGKYYGLSIMRGIKGTTGSWWDYTENDDIPDTLYDDPAPSIDGYDGNPPINGMPYLVLWQKADENIIEAFLKLDNVKEYEWLSYIELCDKEEVNVYYYPAFSTYPAHGWYDGTQAFVGEGRTTSNGGIRGPYIAYKLTDRFGVMKYETVPISGVSYTFLGMPGTGDVVIRDDATGAPIENVAFIMKEGEPTDTYYRYPQTWNYRIYPKPWTTVMARIIEIEDDSGHRANAIQAWTGNADTLPRGMIKWSEDDTFLSSVVWDDHGCTSKEITNTIFGYQWPGSTKPRLAYIDSDYPKTTYNAFYTTEDYPAAIASWGTIPEVGLQTLGIDYSAGETAYFDDVAVALYTKTSGLLNPVQSE